VDGAGDALDGFVEGIVRADVGDDSEGEAVGVLGEGFLDGIG